MGSCAGSTDAIVSATCSDAGTGGSVVIDGIERSRVVRRCVIPIMVDRGVGVGTEIRVRCFQAVIDDAHQDATPLISVPNSRDVDVDSGSGAILSRVVS